MAGGDERQHGADQQDGAGQRPEAAEAAVHEGAACLFGGALEVIQARLRASAG